MQQARAMETPEVREARLHQLRVTQQQRLAAETPEVREVKPYKIHVASIVIMRHQGIQVNILHILSHKDCSPTTPRQSLRHLTWPGDRSYTQ